MKWEFNPTLRLGLKFILITALILCTWPVQTISAQSPSDDGEPSQENQLIYKLFSGDTYTAPLPPPCEACIEGHTDYFKPDIEPPGEHKYLMGGPDWVEVSAPLMWPFSPTVKIRSHWPVGEPTECSGMLVDARYILTAAQCVYTHSPERCPAGDDACWVEDLEVIPAYADGNEPLGKSGFSTIMTWTAWTEAQNFEFDLAAIQLRYPIGGYNGWMGVGFDLNNSLFTEFEVTSMSYPQNPPFYGEIMYLWEGSFTDAATSDEILYFDGSGDPGQSGAAYNRNNGITYGVFSHNDPVLGAAVTRITYQKYDALRTFIEEGMPKGEADLSVFNVRATPSWMFPGETLHSLDFYVYNHADTDLEWDACHFDIYLSTDNLITPEDTWLGTVTYTGSIPGSSGFRLSVAPESLPSLPETIHGPGPLGGVYYLGVISTLSDANETNNRSDYYQPKPIWINDSDNSTYFFPIWLR